MGSDADESCDGFVDFDGVDLATASRSVVVVVVTGD